MQFVGLFGDSNVTKTDVQVFVEPFIEHLWLMALRVGIPHATYCHVPNEFGGNTFTFWWWQVALNVRWQVKRFSTSCSRNLPVSALCCSAVWSTPSRSQVVVRPSWSCHTSLNSTCVAYNTRGNCAHRQTQVGLFQYTVSFCIRNCLYSVLWRLRDISYASSILSLMQSVTYSIYWTSQMLHFVVKIWIPYTQCASKLNHLQIN